MEKAKENISFAVTQSNKQRAENPTCQKSDNMKIEKIDTKKELAKIAGVSHDTIHKVKTIEQKAPEEVKQNISTGNQQQGSSTVPSITITVLQSCYRLLV